MIAMLMIGAAAAAYLGVRLYQLSGIVPRGNDDMIFF